MNAALTNSELLTNGGLAIHEVPVATIADLFLGLLLLRTHTQIVGFALRCFVAVLRSVLAALTGIEGLRGLEDFVVELELRFLGLLELCVRLLAKLLQRTVSVCAVHKALIHYN